MSEINVNVALIRCLQCFLEQQLILEKLIALVENPIASDREEALLEAKRGLEEFLKFKDELFKQLITDRRND